MPDPPSVLLTNDDGIDATGIRALREALVGVAQVTVIAPDRDRSGVSRSESQEFAVERRDGGYAVDGTPVDCVHYGRGGLEASFDAVIAGCNDGPNLGAHRITRSGTIAAAVEAGYLGIPGVAVSLYCNPEGRRDFEDEDYRNAGDVARRLVEWIDDLDDGFPAGVDYLSVNVPADPRDPPVRITRPTYDFDVAVEETEDGTYRVRDRFYEPLAPSFEASVTDPVGTSRRAAADEEVSVTPLSATHGTPDDDALAGLVERFERER